jgi:hypothetical protein
LKITNLTADFSDFLTNHHEQMITLHSRFTKDLVTLRQQLATALLLDSVGTIEIFANTYQDISRQKLETMEHFEGVTNSTCIQNLKNVILNTFSLSGFRIDNCMSLLNNQALPQSEQIYKLINTHQLRVNRFLIAFVEESMDDNILIDEDIVRENITARYWDERNRYEIKFTNSVNNGDFNMTSYLQSLNRDLQECMVDVVQNFRAVAFIVEERITSICEQSS